MKPAQVQAVRGAAGQDEEGQQGARGGRHCWHWGRLRRSFTVDCRVEYLNNLAESTSITSFFILSANSTLCFLGERDCSGTRVGESEQALRLQRQGRNMTSTASPPHLNYFYYTASNSFVQSWKHAKTMLQAPGHTKDVSRMRSILLQVILDKEKDEKFFHKLNVFSWSRARPPQESEETFSHLCRRGAFTTSALYGR